MNKRLPSNPRQWQLGARWRVISSSEKGKRESGESDFTLHACRVADEEIRLKPDPVCFLVRSADNRVRVKQIKHNIFISRVPWQTFTTWYNRNIQECSPVSCISCCSPIIRDIVSTLPSQDCRIKINSSSDRIESWLLLITVKTVKGEKFLYDTYCNLPLTRNMYCKLSC